MQSDVKRNGLVDWIAVTSVGIRIGHPILKPSSFQVDMHGLVTQSVKSLTVLSRFGHFDDVTSKLIALFPMKTDLIFAYQRLVLGIINRLSKVCFRNFNDELGSGYYVMLFFLFDAKMVEPTARILCYGIGKILRKYCLCAVPEPNDTVAHYRYLEHNVILGCEIQGVNVFFIGYYFRRELIPFLFQLRA